MHARLVRICARMIAEKVFKTKNKTVIKKACVETTNSRIDDIGLDVLYGLLKLHQRLPHAVVSELVCLVVT